MTKLVNGPDEFAKEALDGFVAVHPEHVVAVDGGVVRATRSPQTQVAVVMGGGSGHFPAFAGWVGPGLAHGAVCGNIFASPSERQVGAVSRAANNGSGVLLLPINYAGDILHFSAAADALRAEGVDVEMVAVTDDIASGSRERRSERRGIAGSLVVAKIVGAAAERGYRLPALAELARKANAATATLGVALSGCTLPGHSAPLFEVPEGRIAVGLGIHGEPGIDELPLASADGVADLLVDRLLADLAPAPGAAVAVVVNGLGATTYDELHVVFGRIRRRLLDAGLQLPQPVVGEFVSSMEMAGLSLTLAVLDAELSTLWTDPVDTPFLHRGQTADRERRQPPTWSAGPERSSALPASSAASRMLATRIAAVAGSVSRMLAEQEPHLGAVDAVAGDGDHGLGMRRGSQAAAEAAAAVDAQAGAGSMLRRAATAWSDAGGGTSGALWAAGLTAASEVIGDDDLPPSAATRAVRAFAEAIIGRGGAMVGDKTMVDAIVPFVDTFEAELAADGQVRVAWLQAAETARAAADATAAFVSSRGRSKMHGERSLGTPDAGALSFAMVVDVIGDHL